MEHRIADVEPGSIAARLGIEPGDSLVSVNGENVRDIIDYTELCSGKRLDMQIRDGRTGEIASIRVNKGEWEGLGVSFDSYLMSRQRRCANRCIFCFEDQLPKGSRDSLRAKDDDWRLSLIMGNFVTLTNVGPEELRRIIKRKASPLYISVHALGNTRVRMMNNAAAGDILEKLTALADAGISFHSQIVLCPGFNDSDELDRTLETLNALRPAALTVAVVPVGLTAHREGLQDLRPFTREEAGKTIDQIEKYRSFAFPSDEFYVLAGRELPPCESYGEFPQIENGVGLMRRFEKELEDSLEPASRGCARGKTYAMATGYAAYEWLKRIAGRLEAHTRAKLHVYAVRNDYFGGHIDVAGLVTGGDIARQLKGMPMGDGLLIPATMLRPERDVFLDDMTVAQLESALNHRVNVVGVDGGALLEFLQGKSDRP